MKDILENMLKNKNNFVFVGEAGCGKSELAINFALQFAKLSDKPVHFFDLDQTKPLFRSRDVQDLLEESGIIVHYQEQIFDAPTVPGGVKEQLLNDESIAILDVGGDHIGARIIGAFEALLNKDNCQNFFVINAYRPWSKDLISIDGTMARVLGIAHIQVENISIVSNPNLGIDTRADEIVDGHKKLEDMLSEYFKIDYLCALEALSQDVALQIKTPLIPIKLFLTYEWLQ